jgi:flagellar basal-body rod modification protein FlgD
MTTVNTTQTPAANGSTKAATVAESRTKLNANFDTFIKMLTTQLQYQDPLKPMDTTQFTNQLVMYSQVEQQLSGNEKLDKLISLSQGQGTNAALGYLGWEVSAQNSNLPLQAGKANFSVTSEKPASKVAISITDSAGRTVRGITTEGNNKTELNFSWDGKDNNGNQLSDGAYKISVIVSDAGGGKINAKTYTSGVVTGIGLDESGNTLLEMGTIKITPSAVRSVRAPTVASES